MGASSARPSLPAGLLLLACALAGGARADGEAPPAETPAPSPVSPLGGGPPVLLRLKPEAVLEHRAEEGCWVGTGGIVLKRGTATVTADRIVYWEKEEAAYAEGFVVFEDAERRIFAERCSYSWTARQGRLEKGRIIRHVPDRGIHYYLSAECIRIEGQRTILEEVTLTTCSFADPHYAWRSKEMVLTEGRGPDLGQLVSRGNLLQVGQTPIGYLPIWSRNLGKARFPLKDARGGRDKRLGLYLRTEWEIPVLDHQDVFFHLDEFAKHGTGGGPEMRWSRHDGKADYEGRFLAYGIRENGDDPGGATPDTENRGWIHGVDHRFFGEGWSSILEFSRLSDRNFLPLYFEKTARTGKEQENRAYLQRIRDDFAGSVLLKSRLNDFQDQVEYEPKADFRVLSKSFLDGRLLWNATTEVAAAEHRTSETGVNARDQDVNRLDTRHEAVLPFPAGFAHGQLFIEERGTWYSRTAESDVDKVRLMHGGGARLGTQFIKPLATTSEFWNIRALRHILVPQVEYRTVYDNNIRRERLQPIDAVDAADRFQRVTLSLDNIWQAKRRPATRVETDQPEAEPPAPVTSDFATLFLRMHYFPEPHADNQDHAWSPLEGRFRVIPRDYLAAYTDWTYNPEISDGLETWNVGFTINPDYAEAFGSDRFGRSRFSARALESDRSGGPALGSLTNRWSLNVENRFVKRDSSITNATATYQFSERWSVGLVQEYDWLASRRGDRRFLVRRDLHEWLMEFTLEQDAVRGNSVFLLVYPKGLF